MCGMMEKLIALIWSLNIVYICQTSHCTPRVVVHACNPSTQEAEAEGLRVQSYLHNETLSQKKKKKKKIKGIRLKTSMTSDGRLVTLSHHVWRQLHSHSWKWAEYKETSKCGLTHRDWWHLLVACSLWTLVLSVLVLCQGHLTLSFLLPGWWWRCIV
jgi:hypothetical protein